MNNTTTVCASECILLSHHPDLARKPESRPGLIDAENRGTALAWNVFRSRFGLPGEVRMMAEQNALARAYRSGVVHRINARKVHDRSCHGTAEPRQRDGGGEEHHREPDQ